MLVLTRNKGKQIILDGKVVITVLGADRNQARIGISAAADVEIHRDEIFDKINGDGSSETLTKKLEKK